MPKDKEQKITSQGGLDNAKPIRQTVRAANNELINMGSLIEEAIEMAITALMKQDAKKQKDCRFR